MTDWKDNLIKIAPYVAGEQPDKSDFIKLNANENPYPPSPMVTEAIKSFDGESLKRYPNADALPLMKAIAEDLGVDHKNVFVGNGSDDVLAQSFRAFFNSDKPVIFPDITYSFYPVWCEMYRIPYKTIPVDESFNINAADYGIKNGGVVIANPNAPTSIGRGLDFMREILDRNQGSVVISDEAYVDFGGCTALPLLKEYENLLVVRTFSKSRSMAGSRIGFAVGGETLISALRAAKDSYNSYPLDSVAIAAGCASIADREYFTRTLSKVMATRDRLTAALRDMGFVVPDSSTNFVFAHHDRFRAEDIYKYLVTKDIYVRYFRKPERINDHLRITVGTDEQTDMLINSLREYIR
ncbi:MAG: histidinol-phosphate transaminase [Oscillospiraceae bacterium]|nr:histidinol-phosphate transaminase [Oscillospiraceae bacterium]